MFARKLTLAIAATAFMAGTALAQESWVEIDDDVMIEAFQADADTVEDWDVYDADGNEIGEVEDVVGTDAQTPTALIVDFDGSGGYADQDVVIPLENFEWQDDRLVLTATAEDVAGMEVHDD